MKLNGSSICIAFGKNQKILTNFQTFPIPLHLLIIYFLSKWANDLTYFLHGFLNKYVQLYVGKFIW